MAEIVSVTVNPNPIFPGQQYTITVTMTATVSTATAIDIWIRNDPTGALFYDSLITVPANQLTGTFTNNFPLTFGNRTLRIEAKKHGAAAGALLRMFDLTACDTHGIEVYKDANIPVLLTGMVGSRVFIKIVTAQSDGSYENLLDVPSGDDLRIYCIYAGGYSWTTSTVNISGKNCARITFNSLPGYDPNSANKTKLAVFANKTYEPEYGITVENDDGQRLISTIYPVPVFLQKVSFEIGDVWSYQYNNRAVTYKKTLTVGSDNANKIILWRVPINPQGYDNIWFTGTAFIESSANNQATIYMTVILLPPTPNNVSYNFPEAYIFQLDNLNGLIANTTYGLELRNSSSQKIFSSDFTHLSIPTLDYINWPSQTSAGNTTLLDTIYSTNNVVNVTDNHGFFLPEFSATQYEPYSSGPITGAIIKLLRGAFRRRYSEDWNIEWSAVTTSEVLAPNLPVNTAYANLSAPVNNNLYFSADTSQYGPNSGSTGGGSSYTVTIALISGTESCTILTGTTCDSDGTYSVSSVTNSSGQAVTPAAYQWSLPESIQGPIPFSIIGSTTSQNVLIRGTFDATNRSTTLKAVVTVDGLLAEKTITITHQHTADSTKPEISISAGATTVGPNQTTTLTFTVSENTTTFTSSDITLNPATGSGAISNFTGSGTTYTATFTAPNVTTSTSCQISVAANTFTDLVGNNNNASTGNPTISTNATKPTVTITGPSAVTINNSYAITFTLSEPAGTNAFTSGDLTLYGGTISDFAAVPGSNVQYLASLDTQSTMPILENAVISVSVNAFNNIYGVGSQSAQLSIPYDTGRPSVVISASSNAILTTGTATITVTFSEEVTNFTISDILVSGGTKGTLSGSGSLYSFVWTPPSTPGTYYFNIDLNVAIDAAGNGNTAATQYEITVSLPDTTAPTNIMYVYNGAVQTQTASIIQGNTIDVYIDWSEAVVNFDNITPLDGITDDIYVLRNSDNALVATTLSNLTGLAPNTARYYKVTFTAPTNHVGSYSIYVPVNVCQDAAGNNNSSTPSANRVTVSVAAPDTTAPILASFTTTYAAVKRNTTFTVGFSWNEAVYDFTNDDVSITDSSGNIINPGVLTTVTALTYNLSVTSPAYDTVLSIYVKANRVRDGSNNYAAQSITRTVVVDSTQPVPSFTASSSVVAGGTAVTMTLNTGESTTQTLVNLLSGITVSGGTRGSISGSGSSYTVGWTLPNSSGTYSMTIAASTYQDAAGNYNTAASGNVTVDVTPPTMSITVYNSGQVGFGEQVGVSYQPSETITGFGISDISTAQSGTNTTVGNGTVSDFGTGAGNYTTYYNAPHWNTTAFKDASTITRTINVANQSYSDVVGNLGSSASATVTIYNNYAQISSTSVTSTYGNSTTNRIIRGSENATITVNLNKANNTGQTIYVNLYIKDGLTVLASYTGTSGISISNGASSGSKSVAVASGWANDCTIEVISDYLSGNATSILYTCPNTLGGKTFSGYYGAGGTAGAPNQPGGTGGTTTGGITQGATTIGSATVNNATGGTLQGPGSGGGYGSIGGTLAWRWVGGSGGFGDGTYGGGGGGVTGISGGSPNTYTGGIPSITSLSSNADPSLAVGAATNLYNFFSNVFGTPSGGNTVNSSGNGWGTGGAGSNANGNGGAGVVGGGGGSAAYSASYGTGGKGGDGAVVVLYTVRGNGYINIYKSSTTSTNSGLSSAYPGYVISINSVTAGATQSFTFPSGSYEAYIAIWGPGGGGAGRPASGGGESSGGGGGAMVVHYYQ